MLSERLSMCPESLARAGSLLGLAFLIIVFMVSLHFLTTEPISCSEACREVTLPSTEDSLVASLFSLDFIRTVRELSS